jgi:hypothetical protein
MTRKLAVVLAACCGLVWTGPAWPGGEKDARSIINKAIQAAGGEDKLAKHQTVVVKEKGTYYGMGAGLPYTGISHIQWPSKARMEIEGVFVMILNGDKGWIQMGGETKEIDKEQLAAQVKDHKAGWITTLVPLKDKAFKLTTIDGTDVKKKPAVGVKVTREGYPEVKLYFDKQSGLLVKSEHRAFSNEDKKEVNAENFYLDYKDMDGVQIPRHLVMHRDGKLFVDSHVLEWSTADKLDSKLFDRP